MELQLLTAISPIDGRYREKTDVLAKYFSEYALIRYRLKVEIEYFIALCELPLPQLRGFDKGKYDSLRDIYLKFNLEGAKRVKAIEATTNHDVKAVEYFIVEQFELRDLSAYKEFIHFGLTSQDVNNTAIPISLNDALHDVFYPAINSLVLKLELLANDWKDVPMLAKTHGQPASPTRLGKEIKVFSERIKMQLAVLRDIPVSGKFGGATGNFNAHHVAYPDVDWVDFGNRFLEGQLKLTREQFTTQISNYDNLATLLDNFKRVNTILIDLCRDVWTYIMLGYFKQKVKKGEVGSSAMPHKVNPIDFENAEGNLGIANALLEHLSAKLPISRLQRDLTDSTVLRNLGVPVAHLLLSIISIEKGLEKLLLDESVLLDDLDNNWAVVAEGIQTILRREGYPNPYEALKNFTRGNSLITESTLSEFIDSLDIPKELKSELRALSPRNYTGVKLF